jgi:hypothetical protein
MCLIIHRENVGTIIPASYLKNGIEANADGWGIMFAESGVIKTVKGLKTTKFFKAISALGDRPLTIHFRFATHGAKNVANAHPFTILDNSYAVMHNGMIAGKRHDEKMSDTYHFANYVLAPILHASPDIFEHPEFAESIGKMVGPGNKLVITRADGATRIVNEHCGSVRAGLWLSNIHSVEPVHRFGFSSRAMGNTAGRYPDVSRQGGWDDSDFAPDAIWTDRRYEDRFDDITTIDEILALGHDDRVAFIRREPELVADLLSDLY